MAANDTGDVAANGTSTGNSASSSAIKRLQRDLVSLQRSSNPQIEVRSSMNSMLEWHFVLHSLPVDTPYVGGCYHGKIIFPSTYPHAPPAILMATPSGRLEVNKRLCLSMTDFHPESWNPAWSVETILVGLLSYFIADNETGRAIGSLSMPAEQRRRMAKESWDINAKDAEFVELFPEFLAPRESGNVENDAHVNAEEIDASAADAVIIDVRTNFVVDEPQIVVDGVTEPANVVAPGGTQEQDEEPECWICRENGDDEPLIHPCACRGSMSGVHASCVEQWVAHHRRNALSAEAPRCSVCHQAYAGSERRPGLRLLFRTCCWDVCKQVMRTGALVSLLIGFQFATAGFTSGLPLHAVIIRICIIAVFSLVALHKVVVLTISLPLNQAPPRSAVLQVFFLSDPRLVVSHAAESLAGLMILSIWGACGVVPWVYIFPFLGVAIIPLSRSCNGWRPSVECLRMSMWLVLAVVFAPFLILWIIASVIWRNPRNALHPLNAGPHIAVAVAVVPMSLTLKSNIPLVALWAAHSGLLAIAVLEKLCIRRLEWRPGIAWWFTLQFTALSAYFAGICEFPEGIGTPGDTDLVVAGCSALWLLMVCALTTAVNWAFIVGAYRTWQHRHGSFTLNLPANEAPAGEPAGDLHGGGNVVAASP